MRIRFALILALVVASCVGPPKPAPVAPRVEPPIVALPPPAPLASDWRDWPQTPGDWRYAATPTGSSELYGTGAIAPPMVFHCDRGSRQLVLEFTRSTSTSATIRTSSLTRTLVLIPTPGSVTATLPATDPLFDAIGFSRGRFVVEQPGGPPLVLPAWAEVERVVEDCRG